MLPTKKFLFIQVVLGSLMIASSALGQTADAVPPLPIPPSPKELPRIAEFQAPIFDKEGVRRIAFRPHYYGAYKYNETQYQSYDVQANPARTACVNKQLAEFQSALKDPMVRAFVYEAHMDGLEVDIVDNSVQYDSATKRTPANDTSLQLKMAFYVPRPSDPPIKFTAAITSNGVCHVFPTSDIVFHIKQKKQKFMGYVLDADKIENSEMLRSLQGVMDTLNGESPTVGERRISTRETKPEGQTYVAPAAADGKGKTGKAG